MKLACDWSGFVAEPEVNVFLLLFEKEQSDDKTILGLERRPHSLDGLAKELFGELVYGQAVCACTPTWNTCRILGVITAIIYSGITCPMIAIALQHHCSFFFVCACKNKVLYAFSDVSTDLA